MNLFRRFRARCMLEGMANGSARARELVEREQAAEDALAKARAEFKAETQRLLLWEPPAFEEAE